MTAVCSAPAAGHSHSDSSDGERILRGLAMSGGEWERTERAPPVGKLEVMRPCRVRLMGTSKN